MNHAGSPKALFTIVAAAALTLCVSIPASADNESRCNEDITKAVAGLRNTYAKVYATCVRKGYSCSTGANRVSVKKNNLIKKVSGQASACYAAVMTDGVAVSNFGPGAVCPSYFALSSTGAESPVATLEDLADCLIRVTGGHSARLVDRLHLRKLAFFIYGDKNEAKCIRNLHRFAVKAWRSGVAEVARCTKHGVKPFACSLDFSAGSKFSRALRRIDKSVSKCKDAAGVVGSLSGDVLRRCHRHISEPADLVSCVRESAVCLSCRDTNALYELGQDCAALAQSRTCAGLNPDIPFGAMAVTNEGDDTVTLYDRSGNHLFGTLGASSIVVGSDPSAAVFNPLTNTLMVTNRSDDSVTFLVATTGDYINGSFLASTFPVGDEPVSLALNPDLGLLFVANRGDNTVTVLDAFNGQPAFGTLLDSTVMVGDQPSGIAFSSKEETIAVVNAGDSTMVMLDGATANYLGGSLGAATYPTLNTPTDVFAPPLTVASEIDQAVAYHNPATGLPLYGTLAQSSVYIGLPVSALGSQAVYVEGPALGFSGTNMVSSSSDTLVSVQSAGIAGEHPVGTDPTPVAVGGHGASPLAFVVEQGTQTLTSYDPGDSFVASKVEGAWGGSSGAPHTQRLAVNEASDTVYLINVGDQSVTFIDASTGAYKFGTLAASTFGVGADPSNIGTSAAHDRVYVLNSGSDTVTYLSATTGAYIGGSLAAASIAIDSAGRALAINETDGLVYVSAGSPPVITYLDATTPAYLGGSLAAASIAISHQAIDMDVDPAAGTIYSVGGRDADNSLIMLDATSPTYRFGTLPASRFDVGKDAYAVAVNPVANLVFVGKRTDILYFDATTGAQVAGTSTGLSSLYLASDTTTGRFYSVGFTGGPCQYSLDILDFDSTSGFITGNAATSGITSEAFQEPVLDKSAGVLWGYDAGACFDRVEGAVAYDVNTMSFAFSDAAPAQSIATGPMPTSLAISQ